MTLDRPAARGLLACACVLGLAAALLALGDAMRTVLDATATRDAVERTYTARNGGSVEMAQAVVGSAIAGAFVVGLAYAAAIVVVALLVRRASRRGRVGLFVCAVLALPGALGSGWAAGRLACLLIAVVCVLVPPAAAAFRAAAPAVDPPSPP